MATKDPRIDAYIAKAPDFAKPILSHLRDVVHTNCPEVEETMKWSVPHFTYKGMLCTMASFKHHCAFGFWKGSLVVDSKEANADSAGHLGRLTTLSDLPSDKILGGYVRKAMLLNETGTMAVRRPPKQKKPVVVPEIFTKALKKNSKAKAAFDEFSPGHQREYIEWIVDAKSDDTRERRLNQAIEWIAEGKSRNWKYERS